MDIDSFTQDFQEFDKSRKIVFLAGFLHKVTVVARDAFERMRDEPTFPVDTVWACNEVCHLISAHIFNIQEDRKRYPDDVFFRIVINYGQEGKVANGIKWALQSARETDINRHSI